MKYRVKHVGLCRYQVVDENNVPVYDDARDGQDRPLVFRYYGMARAYARQLNAESETGSPAPAA